MKNVLLTTTNLQKNQIWKKQALEAGPVDVIHQISIYPTVRRQTFQGFGGAFTEAAAFCWQKLPKEKQDAFMEAYFGKTGLRYTLGRTHMNSCDFSLGNYACVEEEKDISLGRFSTERDDRYLIPMILAAGKAAGKPVGLLLSPWSPPAFMKTNRDMNHGGSLKPEYRSLWADCMARFAVHYRKAGCDVRLMSVQNEPAAVQTWDSCIYTAAEEGVFAADYLSLALKKAGCADIRLLAWDHNKESLFYRAFETLAVPKAAEAIGGFAVHWYTGDHFDALRLARETWPEKELWFTEGCVEYSRFDGMTPLQKAEMYAHDILGNLSAGINGSIDWNLLLDAAGGPNHVGNFCEAPIMLNGEGTDFVIHSEYYYIGHFSRFIKPQAVCLGSSVYDRGAEAVAFENADGTRIAVMLNRTDNPLTFSVTQDGESACTFVLDPHSIGTLYWENA